MTAHPPLLDPDTALERIRAACRRLPSESCPTPELPGRFCGQDIRSPAALPPFDNSAMDGFAVRDDADTTAAGTEWPIEGEQAAGADASRAHGGAWAIMTGARIPEGLDRVIAVERTEHLTDPPRVRLLDTVARRDNIRAAGTDINAGEVAVPAGTVIQAQQLMLLTAVGIAEAEVIHRPRMAIISTGRELVDNPRQTLASGQIYNSNGPFLRERVKRAGAQLVYQATVGDDIDAFITAVDAARGADADMILSTGAVSMGNYDFVPAALSQIKAETLFHKLAIRPGKPLLFARLPDDTLFFGLPGNPISTAVGFRFFVEAAVRQMLGLPPEHPWRVPLAGPLSKKAGLRHHLKASLTIDASGRLGVAPLAGQQSYRIRAYARANAWAVVGAQESQLEAGTLVDVYGLGHLECPTPDQSTG